MNSQIFKEQISKELLFNLLEKISTKTEKYFIVNKISFKKAEYLNLLLSFIDELLPNYHLAKQFYLTRKLTYNSFVTIIRQICRLNSIIYTSKINYSKSSYEIIYYIYF